jgi:hypothetical protein
MKTLLGPLLLAALTASACAPACCAETQADADPGLKVLIIRHGEKPVRGENLTCQGENRARQIPAVLERKFGKIDSIYVPTVVSRGNKTLHSRMFQTATPVAVRNGLEINSQFSAADADQVAQSVREKKGTVLLVWNHTAIARLAQSLGVSVPVWQDNDFDRMLIIRYAQGQAVLTEDTEGLLPSPDCAEH